MTAALSPGDSDNRAGAATIIGLDLLAKSPRDGYTFGIATSTR